MVIHSTPCYSEHILYQTRPQGEAPELFRRKGRNVGKREPELRFLGPRAVLISGIWDFDVQSRRIVVWSIRAN